MDVRQTTNSEFVKQACDTSFDAMLAKVPWFAPLPANSVLVEKSLAIEYLLASQIAINALFAGCKDKC